MIIKIFLYNLCDAFEFLVKQHAGAPLKIKRLARDPERFLWAVGIAQSRCTNLQLRIGALIQDTNMLVPYAGNLDYRCPV